MHERRSANPYEPLQAGILIPGLDETLTWYDGTWNLAPISGLFPLQESPKSNSYVPTSPRLQGS